MEKVYPSDAAFAGALLWNADLSEAVREQAQRGGADLGRANLSRALAN